MMKKLLCLAMALLLAVCMTGCVSAEETVKIIFWHSMSEEAGVLIEGYIRDFNATVGRDKGIEVELVYQGQYAESVNKMNNMLSGKSYDTLPDVMQLDATGKVNYYASGVAYTADDAAAEDAAFLADDLLPAALGNWNFAGVQLGWPFATSTTLLYYNKTLLDSVGAAAPRTFRDIITLAAALPKTTADGRELTPYAAVPNTPTLANWLGQMGSYVVNFRNGSEASATELDCIENGALEAFLTAWKELYRAGALKNVSGSTDSFVTGQLALMTGSSSNVTAVLNRVDGAFELGVGYYPKVDDDASFGATVSGSCLVMFDHGSAERRAAARELVRYLTGAAVQADFAVGTGYIPSNQAAVEEEVYQQLIARYPQYGVALEQLAVTPADMRSVTVGPAADFYYTIQNCISDMLDDDMSPQETAGIMADELGGLLYQYAQANP